MDRAVVIFIAVVTVVSLVIAVLLFVLFLQRRRQRALLMLAIAQEEAERRRRKRRKAGLRKWEIDLRCPEALVSEISTTASAAELFSVDQHPSEYANGIRSLRSAGLVATETPFPDCMPNELADAPTLSVDDLDLPKQPAQLSLEEKERDQDPVTASGSKSVAASDNADDLPLQVVRLPESMETCVICLDEIIVGSRVRSLPCRHVYHSQCIRVWLRRKNSCPCCCSKVIKRRKKRSRSVEAVLDDAGNLLGPIGVENLEPEIIQSVEGQPPSFGASEPRSPSPRPSPELAAVIYHDGLAPSPHERPADRLEETVLDITEPRSKGAGRSGLIDMQACHQSVFRGTVGLGDPEDSCSEVHASETSSHLDEPTTAELLGQVRLALRGESSMLSLNTSVDDTSEIGLSEPFSLPEVKSNTDPISLEQEPESGTLDQLKASASAQVFADGNEV